MFPVTAPLSYALPLSKISSCWEATARTRIGQMVTEPAELILFGQKCRDAFFQEAEKLGIPLEDLKDEETRNRVFRSCLIRVRKATAKAVAAELGIPITDNQAHSIARNILTPQVMADPAPLAPEERAIAEELYFHAIKAAVARQGSSIKDRAARAEAHRRVAAGERGLTSLQKLSRASGCLVVAGMLVLGAASTLLYAVALLIATTASP